MNRSAQDHPPQTGASVTAPDIREVRIPPLRLAGNLRVPAGARAIVVFAHGSGSSRLSPRNRAVAEALNREGLATLLFDLLTPEEETDRANVFDIPLLAERLVAAVRWIDSEAGAAGLALGLFGASTGAAATTPRTWLWHSTAGSRRSTPTPPPLGPSRQSRTPNSRGTTPGRS